MREDTAGREDRVALDAGWRCAGEAVAPRRVHSTALFRGDREVVIVHGSQQYRLRITKADKLILTK
jgi:hemin uptake protein HemP